MKTQITSILLFISTLSITSCNNQTRMKTQTVGTNAESFSPQHSPNKLERSSKTIPELDLNRYLGKWYEIARYDQSFEKNMVGSTAEYSLRKDGKIKVVNSAWLHDFNGKRKVVVGKAKQPDPSDPGKLKVAFFLWFYADYYIFELGKNYEYAVVGSSSPKYLWILSRSKTMDKAVLDGILARLTERGYDVDKLNFIPQK